MEHNLNVKIEFNLDGGDGMFVVTIHDNESGEWTSCDFPYSPDEHPEFDEWIGNAIYMYLPEIEDEEEE